MAHSLSTARIDSYRSPRPYCMPPNRNRLTTQSAPVRNRLTAQSAPVAQSTHSSISACCRSHAVLSSSARARRTAGPSMAGDVASSPSLARAWCACRIW
eukprot:7376695-Prymnesium_polylepis.2